MENGVSFSDGTNRFLTEEDVEVSSTILRAYNNQEVKLSLESRAISSIPKELYECHELKWVSLYGNALHQIPEEFCSALTSLTWLDLRCNCLQSIPRYIHRLSNLTHLLVGKNEICSLPLELGSLNKLKGFNFEGNPLYFPAESVTSRGSLYTLDYLRRCYKCRDKIEQRLNANFNPTCEFGDPDSTTLDALDKAAVKEIELELQAESKNIKPPRRLYKSRTHKFVEGQFSEKPKDTGMLSLPHQSQRHEVAYASEHKLVSAEAVQQTDKQERLRLKRKCQVIRQNNIIQCRKDREILSKWKFGYTKKQQVLASKYRSKSAEAIKEEARARIQVAPFDINSSDLAVMGQDELSKLKTRAKPAILRDPLPPPRSTSTILRMERERIRRDNLLVDKIRQHAEMLNAKLDSPSVSNNLADAGFDLAMALELQLRLEKRRDVLTHLKMATHPTAFI